MNDCVEHPSPLGFTPTVQRLTQAILAADMQIFALIDHAVNAREAGLSMPPSTLILYGKAAGGTPIMLATPQSALHLPLRVLVRAETDGRTFVAYQPIESLLAATGVPTSLALRLSPAQQLLSDALGR